MKTMFRLLTVLRGILTFLMWLAIIGTVFNLISANGSYLNFAISALIWWILRALVTAVTNRVFIRAYRDHPAVQTYINHLD